MDKAVGAYLISTDRARLDLDAIHTYLSTEAYWALGRSAEAVARAVANSLPFGLYMGDEQVGFSRVVTDFATFGWLADVYVLREHRGQGLGKALVAAVLGHPDVCRLPRVMLATLDAHGLYEQYGFEATEPRRFLSIEPAKPGGGGSE